MDFCHFLNTTIITFIFFKMKKTLLSLLLCQVTMAQSPQNKNLMSFSAGHTFMGTGDLRGFNVGFGFQKQLNKHFGIETNLRATSASGRIYFAGIPNSIIPESNKELRFSVSGAQLEMLPVLSIINEGIKISLLAGPVLRHQVSSRPNTFGVSYHQNASSLSVTYNQSFKTNTLGFTGQVEGAVKIKKKNYVGARLAGHVYLGELNWYIPLVYSRKI